MHCIHCIRLFCLEIKFSLFFSFLHKFWCATPTTNHFTTYNSYSAAVGVDVDMVQYNFRDELRNIHANSKYQPGSSEWSCLLLSVSWKIERTHLLPHLYRSGKSTKFNWWPLILVMLQGLKRSYKIYTICYIAYFC